MAIRFRVRPSVLVRCSWDTRCGDSEGGTRCLMAIAGDSVKPVVGNPAIHKSFLDSHVPFLLELNELQTFANKLWDAAREKYSQPPEIEPEGEELEEENALKHAQAVVFVTANAAFDAFFDVFILAGNCRGFAAKMMLRPMYEHLVTASYFAIKPDEAKLFDEHATIEKWKMWDRTIKVVPQVKELVPANIITELDEKQKEVRTRLRA